MKTLALSKNIGVIIFALALTSAPLFSAHAEEGVLDVPFTSQAPLGEWGDRRQKDGCEEASVLMAYMWVTGVQLSPEQVRLGIVNMSDYQQYFYGYFEDSSAADTAGLMSKFFSHPGISVHYDISVGDIKERLSENNLVIVPLNPRVISTRNYNRATTRHTVVVVGYDADSDEVIFHDSLFARGSYTRAPAEVFQKALRDYSSGRYGEPKNRVSAMIVVSK